MKRHKAAAVILLCVLLLASCKPIEYNDERDRAQIIATVNGQPIYKGVFNDKLDAIKPFFEQTVKGETKEEIEAQIAVQKEMILESLIDNEIKRQQTLKYGLSLSDINLSDIEQMYENSIRSMMEFLRSQYQAAGMQLSEQELRTAAENNFAEQGITKEQYINNVAQNILATRLNEAIAKEAEDVTEEEINEYYNNLILEQKSEFEANPGRFETAMEKGGLVVYVPEGYRRIKRIFIKYSDIETGMIIELKRYNNPEALEDTIATAYRNISSRIDEVVNSIEAGAESFEELIEKYSDDMQAGILSEGYFISKNTVRHDKNMVLAAMALENIGDISQPVREDLGASIIMYNKDVEPAGVIPLSSIFEQIRQAAQLNKTEEYLKQVFDEWKEKSKIVRYINRL